MATISPLNTNIFVKSGLLWQPGIEETVVDSLQNLEFTNFRDAHKSKMTLFK